MIKLILAALLLFLLWRWVVLPLMTPKMPAVGLPEGEQEARAVLGVAPDADADAIRAAHRRLLSSVHPDVGGSAELTRRVNAARDVLLPR
jgi:DnaJ homolog subfamily C member 19